MKKLSIICVLALVVGLMVGPVFAIEYCTDSLEPGNSGGWSASLKTFEDKGTKSLGKEVAVDIWIKAVPEKLITAGFWMTYDPSKVSIVGVEVYDGSVLPGPWDRGMTNKVPDADGPGTYMIVAGNLGNVVPDKNSDIIIAKVRFLCKDKCNAPIKISTISRFDTVVGNSGNLYDPRIKPTTFTIH